MPARTNNSRLPRLAIVGRPNVGKSSLTNMLAARKVSIVDDTAGTTRDRVSTILALEGPDPAQGAVQVELTDTGGYGVYTVEGRRVDDAGFDLAGLTGDIERQIAAAVESADLVLLVIDAQAGLTPQDEQVARLLREGGLGRSDRRRARGGADGAPEGAGGRVLVVANKVDGPKWEMHGLEAANLGFGEPLLVGAKNNYRRREFVERLYAAVRAWQRVQKKRGEGAVEAPAPPGLPEMQLAIVGKRNAGKSTLVNTLAGDERMIVSEIPGTTRDAVDVRFEMEGRSFVAIDTAGLRKKKSFQDRIEWYALDRLKQAVARSDVALLLIDATTPVSQIDQHLGHMLTESYKPVVIVVNKWDLVENRVAVSGGKTRRGKKIATGMYEEYLRQELKGLWYAPIAFVSGQKGTNLRPTIDLAFEMMQQGRQRVGTGKLNRLLQAIVQRQGPTSKLGTFAKVYYVSQIEAAPPTIVCVVNKPALFTPNYQRFLLNRFREELPFTEVPIKLLIRARRPTQRFDGPEAPSASRRAARPGPIRSGAEYFEE